MKSILTLVFLSVSLFSSSQSKKIKVTEIAPNFAITDVNEDTINLLVFKGKKVLINFYRSVGCPVCNLYFHEIQEYADTLKQKNVVVISVYESPATPMKKYLEGESFYSIMIPDSTERLYHLYKVQRSWWKMFKANFTGVYGKIRKGYKLYKEKIKYDAHLNRIGADFLIDENSKIVFAYYGKYFGDHIKLAEIKKYL
jgi:thioredoxin-dependent peroxiredoxin